MSNSSRAHEGRQTPLFSSEKRDDDTHRKRRKNAQIEVVGLQTAHEGSQINPPSNIIVEVNNPADERLYLKVNSQR